MIALLAVAWGADCAVCGTWAIDLAASDKVEERITSLMREPPLASSPANRYAPDQGADARMETGEKTWSTAKELLFASGRIEVRQDGEVWHVGMGGDAIALDPSKKWTKMRSEDGYPLRIRAESEGDRLVVTRRLKGNSVVEVLLPPQEKQMPVVVELTSSALATSVEFRRVYRKLD